MANARLVARLGSDAGTPHSAKRAALLPAEINQVLVDIKTMWDTLAQLNPEIAGDLHADPQAAIDQIRKGIIESVQMRRRSFSTHNQERAEARSNSVWFKFLAGSTDTISDNSLGVVSDETEPHVVLPALDANACNFLGKRLEQFPGLVLRASTHRSYPLKTIACHLLGRMSRVTGADVERGKKENLGELREYLPNDSIGREGVEALCEPLLRGTRGKIQKQVSDGSVISQQDFIPGKDVRLSIDTDLQKQVEYMLSHVVEQDLEGHYLTPPEGVSMHAAAVVLDVKTNQVRVMASNPGFDVNDLQTRYAALISDTLNEPLRDRATSDECEPGSTVKPLIGLGAITQGAIGPMDTINCTGILILPGDGKDKTPRRIDGAARCWFLSEHVVLPPAYQHTNLTFAHALERSCDIFFETVADRLGRDGVNHWYEQFGFGRPTGIGIYERSGLRPEQWKAPLQRVDYCLAGMGQGKVLATPLQVANEAATIARGGIWMRPTLLASETQAELNEVHSQSGSVPDSIDLHLSPEALAQAKIGMVDVVDAPAGTGKLDHPGYTLAAKTGTAETSPLGLKVKTRDAAGNIIDAPLAPVQRGGAEGIAPWYRASGYGKFIHGWFMGYAPVENPQIAFCVLVEYSGVGGSLSAGPVAKQMLEAFDRAGYLHPPAGQ
jgi:penicillin-binding protein 2